MDLEFDKQIDALLRRTAKQGGFYGSPSGAHIDADELSLFAENLLPDRARAGVIDHLSSCDDCRQILARTIELNAAEPVAEMMAAPASAAVGGQVPWYRSLFQFGGPIYAMGALVIVFSGFLVYTLMRSNDANTAQVSQIEEEPYRESGPSAVSTAVSNAMSANTLVNSNSASTQPLAQSKTASAEPLTETQRPASDATDKKSDFQVDGASGSENSFTVDGAEVQKMKPEHRKSMSSADVAAAPPPPPPAPAASESSTSDSSAQPMPKGKTFSSLLKDQKADKRMDRNVESANDSAALRSARAQGAGTGTSSTRNVGGRTFDLKQGVWYDRTYSGGKTISIRRGTSDYRSLDAGIRVIADTLKGTVIIVSNQKAYRIQ